MSMVKSVPSFMEIVQAVNKLNSNSHSQAQLNFWRRLILCTTLYLLRGAWRDCCFPESFSCFLHETGLENLKITSARCFLLDCQRKDSKKSERAPPVSWRPWALAYSRDRPYNFSCLSAVSKKSRFTFLS